jgi:hypothetical protein
MKIGQVSLMTDEAQVEQRSTWVSFSILAKQEIIINILIYN